MTSLMLAMLLSCNSTDPRTDILEAQVAELTGRLSAMENEVDRLRAVVAEQNTTRRSSSSSSSSTTPVTVTGILPRQFVDDLLEDPDKASSLARAIPHRDSSGEVDGYRLSAVRRSSPLAVAGLKNGDIIHAINGRLLADPELTQELLLDELRGRNELTIDLTRRGTRDSALIIKVE